MAKCLSAGYPFACGTAVQGETGTRKELRTLNRERVRATRPTMRFEDDTQGTSLRGTDPSVSCYELRAELGFEQIIGSCPVWKAELAEVERVAPLNPQSRTICAYHFASPYSTTRGCRPLELASRWTPRTRVKAESKGPEVWQ